MKTIGELGKYQRRRRILIGLVIALLIIVLLFVRSSSSGRIHEYVESMGLSLIVLAIVGRMWCTIYIGGRKSSEIVRSGPYSVTRNPLYVFSTVGAIGIGAQTGSVIVALGFGVLCYIAFSIVINTEEKFLNQHFGDLYYAYCKDVPRFFPKFSIYIDDFMVTVKPDRLYRTLQDGLVFFFAYPFFEFVEYLQNIDVLPTIWHLI